MPPRKSDGPKEAAALASEGPAAPAAPAAAAAAASAAADTEAGGDRDKDNNSNDKEAAASDAKGKDGASGGGGGPVAIEDLSLPKSIITRLAKGVLPPNTQIQANAISAMSKSATVFISHLANAANERVLADGKKNILPAHVYAALDDVECADFRDMLQAEFDKFNDTQTSKRNTYRRKVAAAKKGIPFVDPNASMMSNASGGSGGAAGDVTSTTAAIFELADLPNSSGAAGAGGAGADAPRSVKKHKPNAPGDSSAMDVDGDGDDPAEEMDAETEPEEEEDDEDDEEDDEVEEDEEDEEEVGDEDEGEDATRRTDALEERKGGEAPDEALDDGDESD